MLTLEQAITKLRSLEFSSREGWPMGYSADEVTTQALEAVAVLDAQADSPEAARRILERIASKAHQASVPRRKRA